MTSISQPPVVDPAIDEASRQEILDLIAQYHAEQNPDTLTLARVRATANRFYRAGLGSPQMHLGMMKVLRDHFARLGVSRIGGQGDTGIERITPDLGKISELYFGAADHGRSISNILSYVRPYQAGLAHAADIAIRLRCLRAVVRAARRVAGPLQRLHWPRLQAEISPHLRKLSELEVIGSATEASPAGSIANAADTMLRAAMQARQLDRLDVLLDVLAGIHAVAVVDSDAPQGLLARRGRDVRAVARQLWELHLAMTPLDIRLLAGLLPASIGDAMQAPLGTLARLLEGTATAAEAEVQALLAPMGRPRIPDPLQLGIEQLALLWRQVHSTAPASTDNRGSFGDMCLTLFGPNGLGFASSAVRGKVRQVAHALAQSSAG